MKIRYLICVILTLVIGESFAQGLLRRNNNNNAARPNAPAVGGQPLTPPASGSGATGGGEAFAAAAEDDEGLTSDLNFRNAELDQIFLIYGKLVEKTVLKDPGTPSLNLTFQSRRGHKLTKEEQIEAIEVLLEMNGIHFENYGDKFVRAVARSEARKEGIPLYLDIEDPDIAKISEGRVISVNLNFKNIATEEAQKALEGFKSKTGLLQVFERTNSIVVTDTKQNIMRMAQIAKMIDIATPVMEIVEVIQIKNASATEVQEALQKIVEDAMKYQEKDGKVHQNASNNSNRMLTSTPTGSLLRRPGQHNQPTPPANVESLITSVSDADRGMIRGRVLIVPDDRSNKLIIVTNKTNMEFFRKVIDALDVETTPDTLVKVYRLKYADAEEVSDMINDLIGNSPKSSSSSKANQNQNARSGTGSNLTRGTTANNTAVKKPANQRTGEAKAGELSKDNTTVLADKRINGLVVMTQKELVPTVESIIESMDIKLSQVLIETLIVEVTLTDTLNTGVDWVRLQSKDPGNHGTGGGGGTGSELLKNLVNGGVTTAETGASPIGSGINYLLKDNNLNISTVIQATKTDNRAKYLASPIVMTVDNKEAVVEATSARQFIVNWQSTTSSYAGSGLPTPQYSQKDIGITLKMTPKINPNGTIMLSVEEEYSQVAGTQKMLVPNDEKYEYNDVDIPTVRKMSSDVLLENSQTVVLGGLVEKTTSEDTTGIPILKDIPWVGKWLFGKVKQTEERKELLVFLTPYVLNDAESSQAEAMRRKRVLSDAHPWDDNGWSASELADPVSKKEVLRRLKDEAAKQDKERNTRIAIEKWKMDRAKALEKMSEEERKLWIESHKEELDKEAKEKFEKDAKEQSDLQLLAELIKEQRAGRDGDRSLEGKRPSQETETK